MRHLRSGWLVAALLAAACATGRGAKAPPPPPPLRQAEQPPPREAEIADEAERARYRDASAALERATRASDAGEDEAARREHRAAGDGLAALADEARASEWRIVYRLLAADCYRRAQAFELSARQAEAARREPGASEATRAVGARLAAGMWQTFGNQEAAAGRVGPLRVVPASARRGQRPAPRPLEAPWRGLVENADAYGATYAADADPDAAGYAGALAYFAAVAHLAHDQVEEGRARLDAMVDRFPAAEQADDAVALSLQTYALLGDQPGYREALGRAVARAERLLALARQLGDRGRVARLERLEAQLRQERRAQGYLEATNLLAAGRAAEAAAAFEAYAGENAAAADAPNALHNAAVAWERAEEHARAAAAREQLLASHPGSRLAATATIALASWRSRAGDHAGAAELYGSYLARWPGGESRCLALQNRGAETFQAGRREEAAPLLVEFGKDPACARRDPNAAARALYSAGATFYEARNRPAARDAWTALTQLQGVTDAVARSQLADARGRLKGLR